MREPGSTIIDMRFDLAARGTTVTREIVAGTTTFLAAAYILIVNPAILGTCGMDTGALLTVTAIAAGVGSILSGLLANAPVMMAPGMGLNAYFAFVLCGQQGVPWPTALGAVFLAGCVFLVLTLTGIRERLGEAVPPAVRRGTAVGIGLLIAYIGLKNLGVVTTDDVTLTRMGPITPVLCVGGAALILAAVLTRRRVPGALLITIAAATAALVALGEASAPERIAGAPPSPAPLLFQLDIAGALELALLPAVLSFIFVDFFDSLGTLFAVASQGGFGPESEQMPRMRRVMIADALSTMIGSAAGTSTVTAYIESSAGVAAGGRTGLTACVTGVLFLLSVFFAPLFTAVPAAATAPVLILIGAMTLRELKGLPLEHPEVSIPVLLAVFLIPLTSSIATGLLLSWLAHVLLMVLLGRAAEVRPISWIVAALAVLDFMPLERWL